MNNLKSLDLKKQDISILIVTGLSGAGKTSVMRALEDQGFFCVDNLPIPLLSRFLGLTFKAHTNAPKNVLKVALGIDSRGIEFLKDFVHEVDMLKKNRNINVRVIFLRAHHKTLVKRFQETRRKHPLGSDIGLTSAIEKEKDLLAPIMHMSDMILETDDMTIHSLRHWVRNSFCVTAKRELMVNIISFGFKYGVPVESNIVYDIRFLPNPYFIPALKNYNGRDAKIQEYLFAQQPVVDYWQRLHNFLEYSLQQFYNEGRYFVTIAIGCTGGKHRSVAFVEKMGKQTVENIAFLVTHRDLGKE